MRNIFENKNILITGGTGSIGTELVKRILPYAPNVVRIFDNSENGLFNMQQNFTQKNLRFLLGDIRDKERLKLAIDDIDVVFHTAAYKHVLSSEYNPFEAVKTNVAGTQNLIEAAMFEEVKKVIFTSSDKAANPSNVMGTTKLLGEKLMTAANYYKGKRKTIFASVRFGNVLASNGSVIPLFKEQIEKGGPITLTHENMTRFALSLEQAINAVFEAATLACGGEVFVPKMPSFKVKELADMLIEELAKGRKIRIEDIGIKSGEKMWEELMTEEESERALDIGNMYVILPQLSELLHITKASYPHASKVSKKGYKSCDEKQLSKVELKEMLYNWRIL